MILTMNSDYFLKQDYPAGLCSGDVMFPVRYELTLFRGTSRLNDENEQAVQPMKTSFRDDGFYWPGAVRISYSLGTLLHSRESLPTAALLTSGTQYCSLESLLYREDVNARRE
jgi:hypothetical protein